MKNIIVIINSKKQFYDTNLKEFVDNIEDAIKYPKTEEGIKEAKTRLASLKPGFYKLESYTEIK
jgi:hypothetical protein